MTGKCDKCGAPITPEQAFCPKCGAVQGLTHQRREDAGFDMAATIVGQKLPRTPPAPSETRQPPRAAHASPQEPTAAPPTPPMRVASISGNRALYLILGLFAALVLGGLLAFSVYVIFSG